MDTPTAELLPDLITFRPVQASDKDRLMAIELEAYHKDPWTWGMFEQEMENKISFFYCMYLSEELVGYGGYWLVLDEMHITKVTVGHNRRGMGLGRRLLSFMLSDAFKRGGRTASLEVRQSNLTARNLYLTAGFSEVGYRKNYYTVLHEHTAPTKEDAVVMLKELQL